MREVRVTRTERDGASEIAFRFKSLDQLLDPDDPSPLPGREVTEFAEEYISSYLDGCNIKRIAGIAVGFWSGPNDVVDNWQADRTWTPRADEAERERLYRNWKKAVTKTFDWVDEDVEQS